MGINTVSKSMLSASSTAARLVVSFLLLYYTVIVIFKQGVHSVKLIFSGALDIIVYPKMP